MTNTQKKAGNVIAKIARALLIELCILFILFCLLIIGIEIYCGYKRIYVLPPNDSVNYTWGHKVRWNSIGFREKNFPLTPLEEGFRIMLLGDSLTWGVGLDESQRFSNLLAHYLEERYPHTDIEVLNFGLGGGPTTLEAHIFNKYYKALRPHLVIVGFCVNDPQPRSQDYSEEREYYFKKIKPFLRFLYQYNFQGTASLMSHAYENFLIKQKKIPFWTEALDRTYNPSSQEWQGFYEALENIVTMSKEITPYPPIFISLNQGLNDKEPTDYNNPDKYLQLYLKWYHQAERAAQQAGFIVVNCEDEFKEQLKGHLMAVVYGEDAHPSPEMNEIYAKKLAETIYAHSFIK